MRLTDYGYSEKIAAFYAKAGMEEGLVLSRVIGDFGMGFSIVSDRGEADVTLTGGILSDAEATRPVAGDWVLSRLAPEGGAGQIVRVLPRMSQLRRADTIVDWKTTVVAANFDYCMMMVSLNANFGLNRIERLLTAAWSSGGTPVLILSKVDVCEDSASLIESARASAPGTDVIALSAISGEGIESVSSYFRRGVTCAVVGSSGVGKSTLLNLLMGREVAQTSAIRQQDSKGRHTTTNRKLWLLPGGGLFLDTPGIRSFGLTAGDDDVADTFPEIEELSSQCRFDDCTHVQEPGCAVRAALEEGRLEARRYESYLKMRKEIEHLNRKALSTARADERKRGRVFSKLKRGIPNLKK